MATAPGYLPEINAADLLHVPGKPAGVESPARFAAAAKTSVGKVDRCRGVVPGKRGRAGLTILTGGLDLVPS